MVVVQQEDTAPLASGARRTLSVEEVEDDSEVSLVGAPAAFPLPVPAQAAEEAQEEAEEEAAKEEAAEEEAAEEEAAEEEDAAERAAAEAAAAEKAARVAAAKLLVAEKRAAFRKAAAEQAAGRAAAEEEQAARKRQEAADFENAAQADLEAAKEAARGLARVSLEGMTVVRELGKGGCGGVRLCWTEALGCVAVKSINVSFPEGHIGGRQRCGRLAPRGAEEGQGGGLRAAAECPICSRSARHPKTFLVSRLPAAEVREHQRPGLLPVGGRAAQPGARAPRRAALPRRPLEERR